MSKIAKSAMTVDGNSMHMSMPFAKVDKAQRLVSGFATLDNVDTQDDVVLAEASRKAFERARGNIREMHQPLAVGRMVDFKEDEFYDSEAKKFYRGIFVTARVSEGAEDTWKKVLDGTLTGFSIGGNINEASNEFSKDAGKSVRIIKDYDLVELSLVDNPANQLANVLSIQKTATGNVVKGMAVETKIETVFVCPKNDVHEDDIVSVRETEVEKCPVCEKKMESAGWFESGTDRSEKVESIVTKFLNPEMEAAPISEEDGGVVMSVNKNKTEEVKVEATPAEAEETKTELVETEETETTDAPAGTEEEVSEEVTETPAEEEEAETPEEVTDEGEAISKALDQLKETVETSLEKTRNETAETIAALEEKVTEATQQFLSKASELDSKMNEFGEKLNASKNRLSELENALEKINKSDAVKKSVGLVDEPTGEVVQKDASWNGAFSGKRGGGNSPRFSVDNLM